jgi:hypothetical protein
MIKFVGPSYQLNTRKADHQRTVNMHLVEGGKSHFFLDSTPGLTAFSTDIEPFFSLLLESGDYYLTEDGGKLLLE